MDRHGIVWETNEWYSNIVQRPFRNAADYAAALEREIDRIEKSAPDYAER